MEAVQVAAGFLEILGPFLRLLEPVSLICLIRSRPIVPCPGSYLGDHHVAVEGALSIGLGWPLNVRADLGDDGSAKGDVRNEVAVHDVYVQPVCAVADGV